MRGMLIAVAQSLLVGACANLNSIHRVDEHDAAQTILIDAKQRAINLKFGKDGHLKLCAEKSPDVFSVLSASASASVETEKVKAGLATALSEQGASFGLRTQLSNAQAELLYRMCEFYANGMITEREVETELRRFQNTIVALLAIEQLTGYAKPTIVSLGGSAGADTGDKLADAQKELEDARVKEKDAAKKAEETDAAATEADTKAKTAEDNDAADKVELRTKATEAKDEAASAKQSADDAVANREAKERIRDAARAVSAQASSGPVVVSAPTTDPVAVAAVATAVTSIVDMALHQTFTTEACLKALYEEKAQLDSARLNFCLVHLRRITDYGFEVLKKVKEIKVGQGPAGQGGQGSAGSAPSIPAQPYGMPFKLNIH